MSIRTSVLAAVLACVAATPAVIARPSGTITYIIDPTHTFPSFEADHMGMSTWRGKFNKTSGTIAMDRAAGTGTVDIQVDTGSVSFGNAEMDKVANSKDLLETDKYPTANFKGKLEGFDKDGNPARAVGTLQLHGVKKPVTFEIHKFKCLPHPIFKRDWCGADAVTTINREEFGMDAGKAYGFDMNVELRVQVEAIAVE
jgi:polyisoprenoid-binding protein YceI